MAQAVRGGNAVQSGLEKVSGAEYPAHYLKWREVDAGAGFLPLLKDVVKSVGHGAQSSLTNSYISSNISRKKYVGFCPIRTARNEMHKTEESARSSDLEVETTIDKTASVATRERVFVGTGLFWGLIIGVVLATAVVILAAQNTDTSTISFLAWDLSTPLVVLILGALLTGIVLDELFGLVYRKRRRRTLRDRDELARLR
jgi:uncharacterized integral membrane protein